MATGPFPPRLPPQSLKSSLEQLKTKTTSNYWKTGSGGMITQFPPSICCSQSHHCCLITVTMRTTRYARRRPLIGGRRLKECKLFWGWPLTRHWTRRKNDISTTCQVWRKKLCFNVVWNFSLSLLTFYRRQFIRRQIKALCATRHEEDRIDVKLISLYELPGKMIGIVGNALIRIKRLVRRVKAVHCLKQYELPSSKL